MTPARLHVNVDHVATIRQQRHTRYPDPVAAAAIAELAGAHGITVHLREDRRHIQDRDVRILRETVQTILNLEMAMTDEMAAIANETKPEIITLVPERREELTTEGGFEVAAQQRALQVYLPSLRKHNARISLFVDPDPIQIEACSALGVEQVELSTASFVEAETPQAREHERERLVQAAQQADQLGLEVAAGHGLDYHNITPVAAIPEIVEFNIGHSIVARAVFVGLERAIREMLTLLQQARRAATQG